MRRVLGLLLMLIGMALILPYLPSRPVLRIYVHLDPDHSLEITSLELSSPIPPPMSVFDIRTGFTEGNLTLVGGALLGSRRVVECNKTGISSGDDYLQTGRFPKWLDEGTTLVAFAELLDSEGTLTSVKSEEIWYAKQGHLSLVMIGSASLILGLALVVSAMRKS